MTERKSLSKKTRFEVFKRDKFTCQYCGKAAPDVILEVDHIEPVSKGGTNDITNLVTACMECNRGKGARRLDDDSALAKQRRQLEMLQERREQLEMMHEWQLGLLDLNEYEIDSIEEIIETITGFGLSDSGRDDIRYLLKKFGYQVVCESVRHVFTYYRHNTSDEFEYAFNKLGGTCFYKTHKRCSQCVHMDEYNSRYQVVTCDLYDDVSNDSAETCDDYKSMFGGGADD